MKVSIVSALSFLASVATANDFLHLGKLIPPFEPTDDFPVVSSINAVNATVNVTGTAFFTQLLDHDDPSKGTFQQRFFWNSEWWAGPGSPVSTLKESGVEP